LTDSKAEFLRDLPNSSDILASLCRAQIIVASESEILVEK